MRYELTDNEWSAIKPMLPNKRRGMPRVNGRCVINGIFSVLRSGALMARLKSKTLLLADRGYDADWIRAFAVKKGARANIPPRCNRSEPICFSPCLFVLGLD